jgi:S-DNA-T family DNA segregation ATPase FtsK/SpoIIIE
MAGQVVCVLPLEAAENRGGMSGRTAVSGARRRGGRKSERLRLLPKEWSELGRRRLRQICGLGVLALALAALLALLTYDRGDPSWDHATDMRAKNLLGWIGAWSASFLWQYLGVTALLPPLVAIVWGVRLCSGAPSRASLWRLLALPPLVVFAAIAAREFLPTIRWPFESDIGGGGLVGWWVASATEQLIERLGFERLSWLIAPASAACAALTFALVLGLPKPVWIALGRGLWAAIRFAALALFAAASWLVALAFRRRERDDAPARALEIPASPRAPRWTSPAEDRDPIVTGPTFETLPAEEPEPVPGARRRPARETIVAAPPKKPPAGRIEEARRQKQLSLEPGAYELPPVDVLQKPPRQAAAVADDTALAENARYLETVLDDFGVKGRIVKVRPGPVVTLYELEPAPGVKSSRVINLSDDIARSMSAVACRVAVVPGRNVIGIELPNSTRETVYLRELLASQQYEQTNAALALVLGKDIGGAPVIADLARMPHLLIAGTTGSGKSVGINTMILSLLYRLPPDKCKFIMIDPKMLELSIYDGIPQLLAPVVTEPKKAIVALRWTVKEMERRYLAMSKLGVRNLDGYNQRLLDLKAKGETPTERVQTGVDPEGQPIFEDKPLPLDPLSFIVVIVDEMADLMLVAGKDIEAAVQRLAQMARAAGIHIIMATQRPSVDVITGTIKANFPTRVSFQVTSKIDSRTILGEQGAEQLLGQGDMLFMAGGGRITRVHGPFVSETELEKVVKHLKAQGQPSYVEQVTQDEDEEDPLGLGGGEDEGEEAGLYRQAVEIVLREKKASTSFIQRKLQIGYNRAARLVERMEEDGIVSPANHAGKREILREL